MRLKNILLYVLIITIISGCTLKTPEYKVDNNTSDVLNNYNLNQVSLSKELDNNLNEYNYKLKLRAAEMIPSMGGSYSNYIAISLKQQLSQNDLYKDDSNIVVKTKLLQNDVDIWGLSKGSYTLSINFKVLKNGEIVYNRNISNTHEFDSHVVGQIAIENAINNYPIAVQKVLNKFLLDEDFIKNVRK